MNNKQDVVTSTGLGVGYVSIMMLFAVICLTVLAVLSFQAAGSNETLNERSISFNHEYYAADGRAKQKLMALDNSALNYSKSGSALFSDDFVYDCEFDIPIAVKENLYGYEVSFLEPINDRLNLSVSITFYSNPQGSTYCIDSWKTVPVDDEAQDSPLGVWNGDLFE